MKHIPKMCQVQDCHNEANQWFDTESIKQLFNLNENQHTFYFCSDHGEMLEEDGCCINFLNPKTGEMTRIETAAYACDPTCEECNH